MQTNTKRSNDNLFLCPDQKQNKSDDDDDGGIMFSVGHDDEQHKNGKVSPNDNESKNRFPWERVESTETKCSETNSNKQDISPTSNSSSSEPVKKPGGTHRSKSVKEGVIRQREFPPWIENREYVNDYTSPTNTLLERISPLSKEQAPITLKEDNRSVTQNPDGSSQLPSVYEIFDLEHEKNKGKRNQKPKEDMVIEFYDNHNRQQMHHDVDDDNTAEEEQHSIIISKL